MIESVSIKKWVDSGQQPEIYQRHPEFVSFLANSKILSQMKITRDQVRESEGRAQLLVEGQWIDAQEVMNRFEKMDSKLYKTSFVVEKSTREVFTYLDNGRGLQKHHPHQTSNNPISKISEEDYNRTYAVARKFVRPEEAGWSEEARSENRPFILQVVTSYVNEGNSNFNQFLRSAKHPYFRIIVGQDNPELKTSKGDVYEVGYGWKSSPYIPLITTQGRFSSPDSWEYKRPDQRVVTNIPISQEEAGRIRNFTLKYHLDQIHLGNDPAFHLFKQNCSVFFREACRAGNIEIPTEITFSETLAKISPDWVFKAGRMIAKGFNQSLSLGERFLVWVTPNWLGKGIKMAWRKVVLAISDFFEAVVAFSLIPGRAALGGFHGDGGAVFRQLEEREERMEAPLRNWRNFVKLPHLNFPSIVQQWQREQPSTVIYERPVKLAIVPPS